MAGALEKTDALRPPFFYGGVVAVWVDQFRAPRSFPRLPPLASVAQGNTARRLPGVTAVKAFRDDLEAP